MNTSAILTSMGILENLVFILLFILSIWSISIIWDRFKFFKEASTSSNDFDEAKNILNSKKSILEWIGDKKSIHALTLKAAIETQGSGDQVDRAVKSILSEEKIKMEKGFTALATLGSNAPFIGLFGTVLGIIQAFGLLSNQKSDTNALMASISFALIATAAGLFVAIPAVIAYNTFNRKIKIIISECESLKDLYLSKRVS